jgi:hypothetical protein
VWASSLLFSSLLFSSLLFYNRSKQADVKNGMSSSSTNLAQEDLVVERPIEIGGVEERDAGVDHVVDELDHLLLRLGRPIEAGHAHASQALLGDLQPLRAKLHSGDLHRALS